jgi:hypothetical protein
VYDATLAAWGKLVVCSALMSASPIPLPIEQLLALFATRLAEVRFPDVDGASLTRAAEQVSEAARALADAEAAVEASRATLRHQQEELLRVAHRALAYARVYGSADEQLSRDLEAISLPRPARVPRPARAGQELEAESTAVAANEAAPPRRRGRPRKADQGALSLGLSVPSAE